MHFCLFNFHSIVMRHYLHVKKLWSQLPTARRSNLFPCKISPKVWASVCNFYLWGKIFTLIVQAESMERRADWCTEGKMLKPQKTSPSSSRSKSRRVLFTKSLPKALLGHHNYPGQADVLLFQLLSNVWLFVTPWTIVCQAPLSFIVSQSLFKFLSIDLVMLSEHLILCLPLLLLPSVFPSIFSKWVGSLY